MHDFLDFYVASDSQGVCQMINIYILMANWVIPGFRKRSIDKNLMPGVLNPVNLRHTI